MTQKRTAAKPRRQRKRIQIYRDRHGDWRFRIRARNGKIIAASSEGYRYKRGVIRALNIVDAAMMEVW